MSAGPPEWMVRIYSSRRLESYLDHCHGDAVRAVNLYHWNVMVSAAFYGPRHTLELALRNAVHAHLSFHFGQADWWERARLKHQQEADVRQARRRCESAGGRKGRRPSADDMVAELNFGFWVALVASGYDRELWVPTLHRAFPSFQGKRSKLHDELNSLRLLRNRIGHHEPIHRRHLEADHAKLYRVLSYIDPSAASGIQALDRVPEILLVKHEVCRGDTPPSF